MFLCEVYNSIDHVIGNPGWVFPSISWKTIFLSDKKSFSWCWSCDQTWQMQFLVLREESSTLKPGTALALTAGSWNSSAECKQFHRMSSNVTTLQLWWIKPKQDHCIIMSDHRQKYEYYPYHIMAKHSQSWLIRAIVASLPITTLATLFSSSRWDTQS